MLFEEVGTEGEELDVMYNPKRFKKKFLSLE